MSELSIWLGIRSHNPRYEHIDPDYVSKFESGQYLKDKSKKRKNRGYYK